MMYKQWPWVAQDEYNGIAPDLESALTVLTKFEEHTTTKYVHHGGSKAFGNATEEGKACFT